MGKVLGVTVRPGGEGSVMGKVLGVTVRPGGEGSVMGKVLRVYWGGQSV